jgi:hypothetical protein
MRSRVFICLMMLLCLIAAVGPSSLDAHLRSDWLPWELRNASGDAVGTADHGLAKQGAESGPPC